MGNAKRNGSIQQLYSREYLSIHRQAHRGSLEDVHQRHERIACAYSSVSRVKIMTATKFAVQVAPAKPEDRLNIMLLDEVLRRHDLPVPVVEPCPRVAHVEDTGRPAQTLDEDIRLRHVEPLGIDAHVTH
jgi:hypothetical protein